VIGCIVQGINDFINVSATINLEVIINVAINSDHQFLIKNL
jgi:hypothetical protein